jgi:hypothetical protein
MMLLFIILMLIGIILTIVTVLGISVFGAGSVLIFGDVIVCIALIVWLIIKLRNR